MRKLLFIFSLLIFLNTISGFGSNSFYGELIMTNKEYGTGAQFPCKVWFNGNTGQMRVDYSSPQNVIFLREYFNYGGQEKYSVCSTGTCKREKWTVGVPLFVGNSSTYVTSSCQTPDWPGPRACPLTCSTYKAQPSQANGFLTLSYTDATNFQLCLVQWAVPSGKTYGREWHFSKYITSGFTAAQDPTPSSTYQFVIDSATTPCPPAVCKTQIDIALVIDESGSIFAASGWNDVQAFVKNFIGGLEMTADGTTARVGLVYFSGLDNCKNNWTIANGGQETTGCSTARNGDCSKCGGRWQQLTTGVITSKADLIAKVNGNTGAGGFTCISCGIDVGIKTLNVFPKANIQKLIVLMTDGAQNRVTGSLTTQGKIAYDQGIKIIAVGTGDYKIEDLQIFATSIYSTRSFNELSSKINEIITSFCLPDPTDCNFCSGLCSCSANCNCPDCNDYNACTVDKCDPRLPPDGTAGVCVTTATPCNDNDVCTQNLCNNSTGCYYTVPTAKAQNQVDTFCKRWICTDPAGYQLTDVGDTSCVQPADKCVITYCNTTVGTTVVNGATLTGSCVSINRTASQYPVGTVISYVNSLGQSLTTSGCARPSTALPCEVYGCFNGSCTYSPSNCVCRKDTDCDDGDGCTTDVCDTVNNKCVRTSIDCWSNLSGGNCKINVNSTLTTATGDSFYAGTGSFPLDANGLPSPNNQARTCDQLACYAGVRSTYTCLSTSNATFACRRATNPCQSGCSDSSCRTLGTWTSNQVNTDCGKTIAKTCNDGNLCTSDSCNTTWVGTSCQNSGSCATTSGGNRCLFPSNATNCNDNNVCTTDTCSQSTGCVYTPRPLPPSNFCFNVGCDSKTGNFSNVNTAICTSTNKCNITYCNTTTQQCVAHNKATLTLGTKLNFIDQYGQVQTVIGCFQATGTGGDCRAYSCDPLTGLCTVNGTGCGCSGDTDPKCDDNNGCTVDTCNSFTGQCFNTPIDCWSLLSNGGCATNQANSPTNATGVANYNAGAPDLNFVNATGTTTYSCDEMACYSGIRSTYTCVSQSSTTFTCPRTKAPCTKGSCKDTICTTLGTWTNGQIDTDCSSSFTPTCTSNACYTSVCNETFVFGSGNSRCVHTYNGTNCEDNNACTLNQCDNTTGCIFPNSNNPFGANKTCVGYACDTTSGWQAYDLGISKCTNLPTNPCQITYCNTTSDSCIRLDKGDIAVGKTIDFIDSTGALKSLSGCGNPGDPLLCKSYTCDSTSGQCATSIAACRCINDASCSDGDGCTVDTCNIQANRCERTTIDCFSLLSNGTCSQGSSFSADIFTGINLYYGNATVPNNFTAVDANGLPSPMLGVSRTCGQLGCYNGQPSQYSCFSAVEGSYTCQRVSVNCSRNGCQDNICRTNGTWSNGQINSDCGTTYRPFCADNDACTDDYCNSTWVPTDPVSLRCIHAPINAAQVCDDGNFCTKDYCDNQDTSGDVCKHSLFDSAYLKKNLCKNATSVCQTVSCSVNRCVYGEVICIPPTLCIFYTCNATTKGVCKSYPTGTYKIDKCGICGGNGLSCVPNNPGNPKKTSIAVALGVGLGVGLAAAAIIIFILSKKSYDYYSALASETLGTVTTAPTYQGGEHHFDTSGYGGNTN